MFPRMIVAGQLLEHLPEVQCGIRSVNPRFSCQVIRNIMQCSLRDRYKVRALYPVVVWHRSWDLSYDFFMNKVGHGSIPSIWHYTVRDVPQLWKERICVNMILWRVIRIVDDSDQVIDLYLADTPSHTWHVRVVQGKQYWFDETNRSDWKAYSRTSYLIPWCCLLPVGCRHQWYLGCIQADHAGRPQNRVADHTLFLRACGCPQLNLHHCLHHWMKVGIWQGCHRVPLDYQAGERDHPSWYLVVCLLPLARVGFLGVPDMGFPVWQVHKVPLPLFLHILLMSACPWAGTPTWNQCSILKGGGDGCLHCISCSSEGTTCSLWGWSTCWPWLDEPVAGNTVDAKLAGRTLDCALEGWINDCPVEGAAADGVSHSDSPADDRIRETILEGPRCGPSQSEDHAYANPWDTLHCPWTFLGWWLSSPCCRDQGDAGHFLWVIMSWFSACWRALFAHSRLHLKSSIKVVNWLNAKAGKGFITASWATMCLMPSCFNELRRLLCSSSMSQYVSCTLLPSSLLRGGSVPPLGLLFTGQTFMPACLWSSQKGLGTILIVHLHIVCPWHPGLGLLSRLVSRPLSAHYRVTYWRSLLLWLLMLRGVEIFPLVRNGPKIGPSWQLLLRKVVWRCFHDTSLVSLLLTQQPYLRRLFAPWWPHLWRPVTSLLVVW